MSRYCGDCGSTRVLFTLGTCDGCGLSLDGEQSPTSLSEGMFHRACWNLRHHIETAAATSAKPGFEPHADPRTTERYLSTPPSD